ncbi:serpin family protein [Roseobacter sp. MH60115]|uniref:serpin family protein n=1 Tax=Roseobacter sp. MH60115 TaxID=2785324 RepID=UPI0018A305B3|nr:serpin family protein [Roseobacter sp. MH60115]
MKTCLTRAICLGACMSVAVPTFANEPVMALGLPDAETMDILAAVDDGVGNPLVSPLSVLLTMGLARAGLEPGQPPADMPPTVNLSYAVWYDTATRPSEAAASNLTDVWQADQETLSLAKDGIDRINAWAEEATKGLIPKLLSDPLDSATVVVTSALHFKDNWSMPFPPAQTAEKPFARPDRSTVDVRFMTSSKTFPSWKTDDGLVVAMGFQDGGYVLMRLPARDEEATETPAEISPQDESTEGETDQAPTPVLLAPEAASFVRVAMPLLDLESSRDLNAVMEELGMERALAEGMQTIVDGGAVPGPLVQSVVFKADEAGVEAAAATAAIGVRSVEVNEAPLVQFDRPFEFFLMMPGIDTALIAGVIRDPS